MTFAGLPARHLVHQGKVAAALGNTAVQALLQHFLPQPPRPLSLPGKELTARVLPRLARHATVRSLSNDID